MQYKSFMEALKGKQHKIDKNKNGQIDAQDFKMLRKEENANESYDFNRAAIAKQRLMNLKGKKVRGARIANLMRAAGIREEEMTDEDIMQLDEVLSADAKAGDWIHDFVHSEDPKFAGKSKKERINMALGAYYAKKRAKDGEGVNESVKTTHEDPLVTVHDKHGLHTHANLSTANHIFGTKVKHTDVHAGPVKTKDGHETKRDLTFAISKHHEIEMKKEEFEQFISQLQLDEEIVAYVLEAAKQYAGLEKEDKPGKIKTAVVKTHPNAVGSETVEGWKDEKKPVKEQYDEEGNVTYSKVSFSQFMEAMTAKQVAPGVTRYTGGSYGSAKGAKYGNTDYDSEDIDKKEDDDQPQKRGRGRPAGSKSGARGPRIK